MGTMLPVIALIGRPNVGKSTLFNKLTRSRDALVGDQPGVTRDRLYARARMGDKPFLVVDTGGLEAETSDFSDLVRQQVDQVVEEADTVFFMVDALQGVVLQDREIAMHLRKSNRKIILLVNKAEGKVPDLVASEFAELGMGVPFPVSAKRGDGIVKLLGEALKDFKEVLVDADDGVPRVAIVGRPNVGKSTLTNRLAGAHRMIVSDIPGTTRDSVSIPVKFRGEDYEIMDTAGVRKKSRVEKGIELFSVVKTLQAIEKSHVVLLVLNASSEVSFQDAAIAGMVYDLGRSMVVVVNKWDGLETKQKNRITRSMQSRLSFLCDFESIYISALHGSNCRQVLPAVKRAYDSAMVEIATSSLNRTLQEAVDLTPPPAHNKRPVRLKFTHQAGKNPPVIVVHGNLAQTLPASYLKYLSRFFSRKYRLIGTPLRMIPRSGKNPFRKKTQTKKTSPGKSGRSRKL